MAAKNLVLVTRTDNGKQFKVSANKIVEFKTQGSSTLLKYVTQLGKAVHLLVDETAADINTAAARTQAITLYPGAVTIYINSDRIIYIHSQTWGSRITYDISGDRGKYQQPPIFLDCTESGATINTAVGNTGIINPQAGKQYWVNGDFIDLVTKDPSNTANFEMLYDARNAAFDKLKLSSSNSYLSLGSNWI